VRSLTLQAAAFSSPAPIGGGGCPDVEIVVSSHH